MHQHHKQQKGFTLIEVMLYIALTLTILTAIVTFFLETVDAHGRQKNIIDTDESIAFATNVITSYIASSTAVTGPSAGSSDGTLTLAMPDPVLNSATVYLNEAGVIVMSIAGYEPIPLTSSRLQVTSLTFFNRSTLADRPSIQIEITGTNTNFFNKLPLSYAQTYRATITKR